MYGVNPVSEAVRARPEELDHVSVARERDARRDARLQALIEACRAAGVRVDVEPREQLARYARTDTHQGVVAFVRERQFLSLEDLLNLPGSNAGDPARGRASGPKGSRFFLALDGVEDPHNLGALLRSADGAGVDGVLIPERRSAPLTGTVAKTSAGASEHVRLAKVTNMTRALETMKTAGVWIIGLDERGTPDYTEHDFRGDCCLVLGSEGTGLHDLGGVLTLESGRETAPTEAQGLAFRRKAPGQKVLSWRIHIPGGWYRPERLRSRFSLTETCYTVNQGGRRQRLAHEFKGP